MTATTFQLDSLHGQNLQVVKAYAARAKAQKATVEDFNGWLERIDELDGLEKEDLVRLHGQLIAWGYLKFQISSSHIGLLYQISPAGKQALERAEAIALRNGDSDEPQVTGDEEMHELSDAA